MPWRLAVSHIVDGHAGLGRAAAQTRLNSQRTSINGADYGKVVRLQVMLTVPGNRWRPRAGMLPHGAARTGSERDQPIAFSSAMKS